MTAAPTFRSAREEDLPRILELIVDDPLGAKREQKEPAPAAVYRDAFRELARFPGNEVIVAVLDGEIVGVMQLTVIPGLARKGAKRAQIEAVRVDARHRGQGLGEAMIEHAIARARAEGCRLVQLTSDKTRADAHRFYLRLGFTDSHVGFKLALDDAAG